MKSKYNWIFGFIIILKGIHGIFEIFAGSLIYFTNRSNIYQFLLRLFGHELSSDPNDFLINHLILFFRDLHVSTQHFLAVYIIAFGVINLLVAWSFLSKKHGLYLLGIIILYIATVYQLIRLIFHSSVILAIAIFIDLIIFVLMVNDYNKSFRTNRNKI